MRNSCHLARCFECFAELAGRRLAVKHLCVQLAVQCLHYERSKSGEIFKTLRHSFIYKPTLNLILLSNNVDHNMHRILLHTVGCRAIFREMSRTALGIHKE